MTTITFDTLRYMEQLKSAGVPESQAKAHTESLSEILSSGSHELATKADLRELELRLDAKMEERLSHLKIDLMKWMTGMLLAQAALIATLVKLL